MRSSAVPADQQNRLSQTLPPAPPGQSDLNLNDVIEVIRHTDPATYQEFQNQLSAMSAAAASGPSSAPGPSKADVVKMKKAAYVKIVEQPASKGLRFRYECEGRSAGSIPGASTSVEHKTFPAIQIVGYRGRAVVVVSAVSAEAPYRPHPHSLVGKEGCKKGVCTLEIPTDTMTIAFPSLGVQCIKKKEIEDALLLRQEIRVDPFQTGFSHKDNPQSLDLNCVRLCFQVFLEGNEKGAFTFALKPVVSDPIYDKKAKTELAICRMTEFSASVAGGRDMLLFCDKVVKDDIQVRFFEECSDGTGKAVWEGFGEFQPSDVHKQYGIAFRTPRYHNLEIEQPVKVRIQLRRPSDGAVSESRNFEFLPLDSGRNFWTTKRLKTNYNIFNSILSADQRTATGSSATAVVAASAEELKRKVRLPIRNSQIQQQHQQAVVLQPTMDQMQHRFQHQQQHLQMPGPQQISPVSSSTGSALRPLSSASMNSEVSNATTVETKASVNEILSMAADAEDMSVYSLDLDNQAMSFGALMKMSPEQPQALTSSSIAPQSQEQSTVEVKQERTSLVESQTNSSQTMLPAASMTSVATVRENRLLGETGMAASITQQSEQTAQSLPAMDVDALYDDVMQCVYDDVDEGNSGRGGGDGPPLPPAIPIRKRNMSLIDLDAIPDDEMVVAERPLPGTPSKIPTIINKVIGGGKSRAEKEEKERRKREEKEERERQRMEKERLKREERAKAKLEKKGRSEHREQSEASASSATSTATLGRQSLFQRLFTRSKSMTEDDDVNANASSASAQSPPAVPKHRSTVDLSAMMDANANAGGGTSDAAEPTEAELNDLQQFIDSGNLEHLDNMVNEFAKTYMPTGDEEAAVEGSGKNMAVPAGDGSHQNNNLAR